MSRLPVRRYPYSLDEPLLWLTPKDPWTIRMACEGAQILGDMGSGKTSGSGKTLAKAMLKAGFGGLVLCKKTDECASWVQYARETGRQDQLLIVHPSQDWRFNFLEYSFTRAGEGAGYVPNAINLMLNLIENRRERGRRVYATAGSLLGRKCAPDAPLHHGGADSGRRTSHHGPFEARPHPTPLCPSPHRKSDLEQRLLPVPSPHQGDLAAPARHE